MHRTEYVRNLLFKISKKPALDGYIPTTRPYRGKLWPTTLKISLNAAKHNLVKMALHTVNNKFRSTLSILVSNFKVSVQMLFQILKKDYEIQAKFQKSG